MSVVDNVSRDVLCHCDGMLKGDFCEHESSVRLHTGKLFFSIRYLRLSLFLELVCSGPTITRLRPQTSTDGIQVVATDSVVSGIDTIVSSHG